MATALQKGAGAASDVTIARLKRGSTRRPRSMAVDSLFGLLMFLATAAAVVALALLLWTILDKGWARLWEDPGAFFTNYVSRRASQTGIKAALVGTAWLMGLTAIFSIPLGVGAAVYLEEFAPKNRITNLVEAAVANLAGVPSIVYGILGLGIFVTLMDLNQGILAGGLTLAVMSLPVIIITTREALRAVPRGIRDAAYGLGATRVQTVFRQILPAAIPGALTGTILALSRAIGETAPLLVVGAATSVTRLPDGPSSAYSALPIFINDLTSRPQTDFENVVAAAIIVLMAVLLAMNSTAIFLRNRFQNRW